MKPFYKFFFIFIILIFSTHSIFSQAQKAWKIDLKKSSIEFYVKAKIENVKGSFHSFELKDFTGVERPENLAGKIIVKTDSIKTKSNKRDAHLKSKDFFAVKKYPKSTITVKSIIKNDLNKKTQKIPEYTAMIEMKIRNKTKSYAVPIDIELTEENIKAKGIFQVNRSDFDVNGNAITNIIVDDNVELSFNLELVSN